jgi:DNA-binding HxlR family transcriptional regulator
MAHQKPVSPAELPGQSTPPSDGLDAFLELFDVLGRRWSLRILWELRDEALSFRALRTCTGGMSSAVLTDRLRDLRAAGIVDHDPALGGYLLTNLGNTVAIRVIELFKALNARPDWPTAPEANDKCPWTGTDEPATERKTTGKD